MSKMSEKDIDKVTVETHVGAMKEFFAECEQDHKKLNYECCFHPSGPCINSPEFLRET